MTGVAGNGTARLNMVTSDIRQAVEDVEIIFIPLPGFTVSVYAKLLAPFLKKEQIVVLMPGLFQHWNFGKLSEPTAMQMSRLLRKPAACRLPRVDRPRSCQDVSYPFCLRAGGCSRQQR